MESNKVNTFFEPTVSVIVPTLNAEKEIENLLKLLKIQTYPLHEIIIVDSESDDNTVPICKGFDGIKICEIKRTEFDHGRTRDIALRESTGDVVVFMTQDCVPASKDLIKQLIMPLAQDKVVLCSGRQLPKEDASDMEILVRLFNYPATSSIRSKDDIPRLGIKTFFCSDVCSAYNRDVYLEIGGFDYPLKTNEDMFYAAKVINAGYFIAYAAEAQVYHSHNFTLKQQYERNYIQGYEIERHKVLLGNVQQTAEGKKLVMFVGRELLKKGKIISFIRFGIDCCARLLGSKNGKRKARKEL